jgi:RNA polymerase sigma-70 factor (ECF subfamily)
LEKNIDYIVEKYSDVIYRAAVAYLGREADAEDIVSEVLIKYFSLCDKLNFNDSEHLKAWLIRVTMNMCKDLLKSAAYSKSVPTQPDSGADCDLIETYPQRTDVRNALEQLDGKYRTVLYLYYYEEYKTEEIAEILHTSKGTVVSRLSRARSKLKLSLSDYGEEMSV